MASESHRPRASFEISHSEEPSGTLLAGFSEFGLAGLTAMNYLVERLDLEETGHVTAEQLPAITPFENGVPRHHTRLFSNPDHDLTVLVGELFVPTWAADPFASAVLDWTEEHGVEEIAVLSGIPIPHGPDEHRVFSIATKDFHEKRLDDADIPGMGHGFLDGVNATLVARGLDSTLATGVFVTPVHPQTPDVEAAIRLIDAACDVYGLEIDTEPLQDFAAEVGEYYAELAQRVESAGDAERPDDRMYM